MVFPIVDLTRAHEAGSGVSGDSGGSQAGKSLSDVICACDLCGV